ncbi:MAG: hypothetical protein AAF317_01610 [Pseudomonadota bacterium]
MTTLGTLLTLLISGVAVIYLAATNAKRRRAFKQPPVEQRWRLIARLSVWLPGLACVVLQEWAIFTMWAGGITVLGWVVAATSPVHLDALGRDARVAFSHLGDRTSGFTSLITARTASFRGKGSAGVARIAEMFKAAPDERVEVLEARIAALEARLARLEGAEPTPMPMTAARSS